MTGAGGGMRSLCGWVFSLLLVAPALAADEGTLFGVERRRDQFPTDFGYFIYPISGKVPGIGSAYGGGGTATNIAGSDTDVTGFAIRGDFEATGAAVLNYHVIDERLIFDLANYTAKVAPNSYRRGIDSSRDDVLHLEVESDITVGQTTLTFFERMVEFYARYGFGSQRLNRVLDADGNPFANVDTDLKYFQGLSLGFGLDLTDDRQDPRRGVRFEIKDRMVFADRNGGADYDTLDVNLTGYLPVGERNVLAFNAFYSTALIRSAGETDREIVRRERGLQCDRIGDPISAQECRNAEEKLIDEIVAENRYGRATGLGGTQRLRSYPMERFAAGQTFFVGTEYRHNLTEEATMMDWYILKGLRTNIQLALFAETGTVADASGDLTKDFKTSVGAGFRILFSGVTIRIDAATGDEGQEVRLFLDYPWSMFSVDRVL